MPGTSSFLKVRTEISQDIQYGDHVEMRLQKISRNSNQVNQKRSINRFRTVHMRARLP